MKNLVKEVDLTMFVNLLWAIVAPLAGALAVGMCARSFITGDVVSGVIWTMFAVPALYGFAGQILDLIERR